MVEEPCDGTTGFMIPKRTASWRDASEWAAVTDIAEEMGVSKGTVSKLAKKAMLGGWLTKDGREYKLVTG